MRALLLTLLLVSCAAQTASTGRGTAGRAADFTLRDLSGRDVRLSDYLGTHVILLDFWATWCVPCEAALPHVEALYQKYKNQGFIVLGIAMDDSQTVAQVAPFAQRYRLSFPVLVDEETKVVQLYNPKRTAPYQVLIARNGTIAKERQGYNAGDERLLESDVQALLRRP
ncbi:MAG: TlpA disulfide reductase family protein [Myxococcales bacterium]|nr:TlpA family protein disulfide reductase [Myxococcota bacterium]MDW8281450.1 TlpA disulfide reductase family protein [Myxococcales bacterium]